MVWFQILILIYPTLCYENKGPQPFPESFRHWADHQSNVHLTNMTANLLRDMTYKLNQARRIQETYKGSVTYELGVVTAGIQESFQHMMEVYRTYSNITDFKGKKYTIENILNAYHIIQGDYNEIRLEKELFNQIYEEYREENRKKLLKYQKYLEKHGLDPDSPLPSRPAGAERPDGFPMHMLRTWTEPNMVPMGNEDSNIKSNKKKNQKWIPNF